MNSIEQGKNYPLENSHLIQKKQEVRDPLEGIINGENRHERYKNFILNVLGKIWPRDKDSGEYGDDFWRATRYEEGDISGYTQSSPLARDPINSTPEEFENMALNLGPDYVRVRSVPPQLLKRASIMPTGGSCPIETWGMRNMKDIQTGIKKSILKEDILADTAEQIVNLAPTVTHISGALLSGQDASVHYIESDMWAERLVSYRIPKEKAQILIQDAYYRIHEAVARRAKLINPNATVIPVNFDELGLKKAIEEWFNQIGSPYDPNHRIAEVIYTYNGPRQKELLLRALNNIIQVGKLTPEEKEAVVSLLGSEYHVRGKQIDHLRWGSMDLLKEVIIGKREMTPKERVKYQDDPLYRMGIDINRDIFERHKKGNPDVLCVGFADLPYNTSVQHESRNLGLTFSGNSSNPTEKDKFMKSLQKSMDHNNPVRLHRLNIDKHLLFLKAHFLENGGNQSKELNNWITLFPLSKNMFIAHGMQFLWDADFIGFLTQAVQLQEARKSGEMEKPEANKRMKLLMISIYPKLEAYLLYMYGRIEYPEDIRNSRLLKP